ncbi:aromatase/cyclase [Streptomyces sp.]|uniref:aromatase/cyclase n=1 Tax=Streptomyces sp. TaxID=1931 RepID=UPI002D782E1E|nr:aromatase/cyclase [Streptomyces sp.]HET6354353.1 aromatase/cyclase [Streptomyces sp.]
MSDTRVHRTSHRVEVAAPAGVLYGLIADTVRWPLFFPPSIHVEQLEFDGTHERLRIWATANGSVASWTSARSLDPELRRVDFRQQVPASSVEAMGGTWIVEARGGDRSQLTLLHDFVVPGDAAETVAWVQRATDTNSRAQLDSLKDMAEKWTRLDDMVLLFEDSVRVNGPAELVYDFLYRAGDWPELAPHVRRVELTEQAPGVQVMSMDASGADGAIHTTESVRICFPHAGRIVFKQTAPPALMAAHTGEWSVEPDATGVTVTAQHQVVLNEADIEPVLGEGAGLASARRRVREDLGRAGTLMLALAKQHAESAVRVL